MIYIRHRVNTIEELARTDRWHGVEVDIRDDTKGDLFISHDPYIRGQYFEDYLEKYDHRFLILNIKSERVEWKVRQLLQNYGVTDYFFLDSSFPMIMSLSESGEYNTAIRISEFESIETAKLMQGRSHWIWLDNFYNISLTSDEAQELHDIGYKICLVSPELQGRPDDINLYVENVKALNIDAICAKDYGISLWEKLL